jgi:hypothetical protein
MLAVVHDLAEAQVGDIAPNEGVTDEQKRQLEEVWSVSETTGSTKARTMIGCNEKLCHRNALRFTHCCATNFQSMEGPSNLLTRISSI